MSSRISALTRVERMLALRSFPGYARLPAKELTGFAAYSKEVRFQQGQVVLRQGEQVRKLVFAVRGKLDLVRDGELFRSLGEKSVVGGLSAFAKEPMRYDVIAATDCVGLQIGIDDVRDLFEDNFLLMQSVLQAVSGSMIPVRKQLGPLAGFSNKILEPEVTPPDGRPLDLVERMAALFRTMTFANSHLESLADLARDAEEVRRPAGTTLWREGDPGDHMLMLISGVVECSNSAGQRFRLGPQDGLGTMEATAGVARWYDAEIREDLVALRIDHEAFFDVLEDNSDMAFDMLGALAGGALYLNELSAGLSAEEALARANSPSVAPRSPGRPAPAPAD